MVTRPFMTFDRQIDGPFPLRPGTMPYARRNGDRHHRIVITFPIKWSSGTKPQYRESCDP